MNLFWGPACRLKGADSSLRSFENKEGKDLLVYVKAGDRHCEDSSVARVETRRNQTPQETWLAADVNTGREDDVPKKPQQGCINKEGDETPPAACDRSDEGGVVHLKALRDARFLPCCVGLQLYQEVHCVWLNDVFFFHMAGEEVHFFICIFLWIGVFSEMSSNV